MAIKIVGHNLEIEQIVVKGGVKIVLTTESLDVDLISELSPIQGRRCDCVFIMPQTNLDFDGEEESSRDRKRNRDRKQKSQVREVRLLPVPDVSDDEHTGIFAVVAYDSDVDASTYTPERWLSREDAVKHMDQLAHMNKGLVYSVEELSREFMLKEYAEKPYVVLRRESDDVPPVAMNVRLATRVEAEQYVASLVEADMIHRQAAEKEEAGVEYVFYTYEIIDTSEDPLIDVWVIDKTVGEAPTETLSIRFDSDENAEYTAQNLRKTDPGSTFEVRQLRQSEQDQHMEGVSAHDGDVVIEVQFEPADGDPGVVVRDGEQEQEVFEDVEDVEGDQAEVVTGDAEQSEEQAEAAGEEAAAETVQDGIPFPGSEQSTEEAAPVQEEATEETGDAAAAQPSGSDAPVTEKRRRTRREELQESGPQPIDAMMMRMVTEFVQGSDPIYQTDDTPNEQKLFPACPGIIFEDKGRGYKASVMCAQFEGRYYHGMTLNSDVAHHVSYPRTFRTPFTSRAWAVEAALEEVAEIASFVSEHPVWIEMMRLVKEKKAK